MTHDYWEGHDWDEEGCRTCRAEKAEAEAARLRKALAWVASIECTYGTDELTDCNCVEKGELCVGCYARAALKGKPMKPISDGRDELASQKQRNKDLERRIRKELEPLVEKLYEEIARVTDERDFFRRQAERFADAERY